MQVRRVLPWWVGRQDVYTAFISYRVSSEAVHASMLYDALNNSVTPAGHRVIVFLDAKRLVKVRQRPAHHSAMAEARSARGPA